MRHKLSQPLHIGFAVATSLTLLMASTIWWITWNYQNKVEQEHRQVLSATIALAEAESALWQLRYSFPQFMVSGASERERILAEQARWYGIIESRLDQYAGFVQQGEERQALAELRAEYQRYKASRPKFFELYRAGRIRDAAEWRTRMTIPSGAATVQALARQINLEHIHAQHESMELHGRLSKIRLFLGALSGVLVLFLALGYWLALRALRPIRALHIEAQRILHKQFGEMIDDSHRNEIETLVESFHRVSDRFTAHAGEIARAEDALRRQHDHLEQAVAERTAELEKVNRALATSTRHSEMLTEITGLLQTIQNTDEAAAILPRFLKALFSPHAGAMYIVNSPFNHYSLLLHWGEETFSSTFEMSECWALRRGQAYLAECSRDALICQHVGNLPDNHAYLCLPLTAQGTTLGLLHLRCTSVCDEASKQALQQLAQRTAEQLALALSNVRLRAALREQSIGDVLTGLYNRRYLEESLAREVARAAREKFMLAVFMLDVDHFKQFNDDYGHEAGDAVLRALGHELKKSARESDLACRFGGEEFTVVLTNTTQEKARDWAERIMERVRHLAVNTGGRSLPGITISLGLAMCPQHGSDPDTLLQAADFALYEAKHAGRDQLAVFSGAPVAK